MATLRILLTISRRCVHRAEFCGGRRQSGTLQELLAQPEAHRRRIAGPLAQQALGERKNEFPDSELIVHGGQHSKTCCVIRGDELSPLPREPHRSRRRRRRFHSRWNCTSMKQQVQQNQQYQQYQQPALPVRCIDSLEAGYISPKTTTGVHGSRFTFPRLSRLFVDLRGRPWTYWRKE